jgi:hypothetical protein
MQDQKLQFKLFYVYLLEFLLDLILQHGYVEIF